MKVYTRTGDRGTTALIGGVRVAKDCPRLESYGTVDELNSHLGLVRAIADEADAGYAPLLADIQCRLFDLGAYLATPSGRSDAAMPGDADVEALENAIDAVEESLPPLKSFILPGGSVQAAQVHVARAVCRRAERRILSLSARETVDPVALRYINRLSDFLFVYARRINLLVRGTETPWLPRSADA